MKRCWIHLLEMHELPANIQNDPELKRKNIKVALPLEADLQWKGSIWDFCEHGQAG